MPQKKDVSAISGTPFFNPVGGPRKRIRPGRVSVIGLRDGQEEEQVMTLEPEDMEIIEDMITQNVDCAIFVLREDPGLGRQPHGGYRIA
jgi:hypothetical protein